MGQLSVLHQFTDLRATASIPRRLVGLPGPIALRAIKRRISRLIVDGARPSEAAIARIDLPTTSPREISSRSIKVNADLDRCRSVGRIPPDPARRSCIDERYRSNSRAI